MISLKSMNDLQITAKDYGVNISELQLSQFQKYYDFITEWNEKINLISRKENESENDVILERHFLDSIVFLPEITALPISPFPHPPISILDIGSGGGFPAVPLAIMKPEWDFTLCESISKKAGFLTELTKELKSNNVKVVNARAETLYTTSQQANNKFNFVTARAVAKIDELIKYSLPTLKKGGSLLAFKGPAYEEELKNAKRLIENKRLKVEVFSKEVNGFSKKLVVITQP